jgi:rubrerythrin
LDRRGDISHPSTFVLIVGKQYSHHRRLLSGVTGSVDIGKKENLFMKTDDNLKAAFAGESQANRKYLAFAKKAEQEGFKQVAKLFRAAAEAETVHAHAHLRVLGGIRSTKENIQEAIAGETHEFKSMYPGMMEAAKSENNDAAFRTFHFANEVEKIHASLYSKALESLGKNEVVDYYVCPYCGNTVEKAAPDKCPICGAPGKSFIKIT